MPSAPTRLDKLLQLLQSENEAARLAAARQLGGIQKEHPHQLHSLLPRVLRYLFSEEWATRRAAAHALEAIAEAVPPWQPGYAGDSCAVAEETARMQAEGAWLGFATFDMARVLKHGT